MSRKHLSRITVQAYGKHVLEYSVDGEPVSMSSPLQVDGLQVPFYHETPVLRALEAPLEMKTLEGWISHQVSEFHTGLIHYAQSGTNADDLAYQIAESYLLRKLINLDKI